MTNSSSSRRSTSTFSKAFEQVVNFAAVSKTANPEATLQGLVKLCLVEFGSEKLGSADDVARVIEDIYCVRVPDDRVASALDALIDAGEVTSGKGNVLHVSSLASSELREAIDAAAEAESEIKEEWREDLALSLPSLPFDSAWKALQSYLSGTFRQHGLQAAAMLDPSFDLPDNGEASLEEILRRSVREAGALSRDLEVELASAIRAFMQSVAENVSRAQYISQLADAAFNFYTLEVPREVTEQLCSQLEELTLFLDTNFLFGILELHSSTQVQASCELLKAVRIHNLPFKLRYHEKTLQEMRSTIAHYGGILRSRRWPQSISRAAVKSGMLSGIEQKFHEQNADHGVDIDEFMRILEHFDTVLDDHGIKVFRPHVDLINVANDIYHDYQEYLDSRGRGDKSYETVMHDAAILAEARDQRTRASSSLRAGALVITCDYHLYRFDLIDSRKRSAHATALLPNVLWQILRPLIASSGDYDRAFAETFSLPQFRAFGGGGNTACRKMLEMLATYKDVPEATATKMLANGVLIDRLKSAKDDDEFAEQIEAAFVEENRLLQEEQASLSAELSKQQSLAAQLERDSLEAKRDVEEVRIQGQEAEKNRIETQRKAEDELCAKEEELADTKRREEEARTAAEGAIAAAKNKDEEARQLEAAQAESQRAMYHLRICVAVLVACLLVGGFLITVHWASWQWLLTHKNSLGIQAGTVAGLALLSLGLIVPGWRKWCLGVALLAVLVTMLSLING